MKRAAPAPAPLRAFFAWLEKNGGATVPRETLVAALGSGPRAAPTLEALLEAGIVREGPPAVTLPCGEGMAGCAREVLTIEPRTPGAGPTFLATCGAFPRECETIGVTAESLRQLSVSVPDLARLMRELFGVTEGGRSRSGSGGELVLLGEQPRDDGTARDVVLVVRPRPDGFDEWLDGRTRGVRGTLVLLPTARALSVEAASRHGPGAHVEVDTLCDVVSVRDGALALAPRLRAVRPVVVEEAAPAVAPAGAPRRLPKAKRWEDVRITLVDGETVSVEIAGKFQRLTYIDMGLVGRSNRKATKAWALLVACCEGKGTFRWKVFGTFENARQVVTRLRKALRAVFAVDEDPFHDFTYTDQWRTRFRAGAD